VLSCHEGSPRTFSSCAPFEGRTDLGGAGSASGLALYDKRTVTTQGPTGATSATPIRYADVELISCQTGAVLGSGETDGDGLFQVTFNNPGRVGVYVRVLSSSSRYAVSVRQSAAEPFLYGLASLAYDDAGDGEHVEVAGLRTGGTLGAGAFNILDQGIRGGELVEDLTGASSISPLVWYWFPGNPNGTSYNQAAKAITVLGTADDPDEFDDAVLLHEYGHFVLDVYSRDDSPGGPHRLTDSTMDLRLAWSEGWATFFSSAVRNDPIHVDTSGDSVRLVFDIEGPSFGGATRYDTNELAVAAVLWDVYDAEDGDEGTGPLNGLLSSVWSVVQGLAASPVSFENFWVAWQTANPGDLRPILEARSIDLWADDHEAGGNDDDPSRAAPIGLFIADPGAVQHHSLYPAGDVDYVRFTAPADGTYAIATSHCAGSPVACDARVSNAADTILDVLGLSDGAGSDNLSGLTYPGSCASGCPPNDASTLSSRVTFAATAGAEYVIQIARSPVAPPSAGQLGTYDVLVTAE
jgi:hypothetical protein